MVITIDGAGGTGKSSSAKLLAQKLGYLHLNSGTLYRWITYNALQQHLNLHDSDVLLSLAESLDYQNIDQNMVQSPDVSDNVAQVAKIPAIRDLILDIQRKYAQDKDIVVEGRDIGTVVFPDADYKFYFTASLDVRAKRRYEQLKKNGLEVDYEQIRQSIADRDRQDIEREHSPLRKADDAIEIPTDNITVEEGVDIMINEMKILGLS